MIEHKQANGQTIFIKHDMVTAYAETDRHEVTRIYTIDGRVFDILEPIENFREKPVAKQTQTEAKSAAEVPTAKTEVKK